MDEEFPPYGQRIKAAREGLGISQETMASRVGISINNYYDLESFDDEVATVVDIKAIRELCQLFGISVWHLIAPDPAKAPPPALSLVELRDSVKQFVSQCGLTAEQFTELSGWDIAVLATEDPATDWNLECVKHLSNLIGIDWLRLASSGFSDGSPL